MKELIIKRMRIKDYTEIHKLWESVPGMGLNNLDDSKTGIHKYLKRNPTTCFTAKIERQIVGTILCGHDGRRGFIYHAAVSVSAREKGIGRKLVNSAVTELKKLGINKVAFVVFKENEIGNGFWETLGFEKREDIFYRDKVITDIEMVRIST